MAEYLGIDADSEGDLLDIATMAVAAPTPPGWQQIDSPDGSGMFRSFNMLRLAKHGLMFCIVPACILCLLRFPSVPSVPASCA